MPNFNIWSLLAIIAAAQGSFLSLVLFFKKQNRLPNRLIGFLLLLLAVTLSEWSLWWSDAIQQNPGFMGVSAAFPLLYGVIMLFYFEATFEHKKLRASAFLHILPFLTQVFFMLPFYLRFYRDLAPHLKWIPFVAGKPWFIALVFTQMIAYGLWIGWRFKKYFKAAKEMEKWRRWLLSGYWGIVATYLLYRLLPYCGLDAPEWKYLIAGSLTFFIYLTAWLGYIEPKVFSGEPFSEAIKLVKYSKSSLAAADSAALYLRITALMETEHLYRNNDLDLESLADRLNAQRHHISQAINQHAGKGFSPFINEFRVLEAQQLLESTPKSEKNAIEIAYAVGFNTKEAFNITFKKISGMTPGEYRQAARKKV